MSGFVYIKKEQTGYTGGEKGRMAEEKILSSGNLSSGDMERAHSG